MERVSYMYPVSIRIGKKLSSTVTNSWRNSIKQKKNSRIRMKMLEKKILQKWNRGYCNPHPLNPLSGSWVAAPENLANLAVNQLQKMHF